jgi:hypothetical protein
MLCGECRGDLVVGVVAGAVEEAGMVRRRGGGGSDQRLIPVLYIAVSVYRAIAVKRSKVAVSASSKHTHKN